MHHKLQHKWGREVNSAPVFSFPFVPPPSSKNESNGGNANAQATQCKLVPFRQHSQSERY